MVDKKILINDLEITYKVAGSGPAILILHGWGSNSEKWDKVAELLSKKGIEVIIPDLPGFGKSQAPSLIWGLTDYSNFVQKFINSLDFKKIYLLGHSFGGAVAVKCGLKFPEKIEKLFLVDAACFRKETLRKKLFYFLAKIFKIFSFLPFYWALRKGFYKFIIKESDYPLSQGIMKDIYLKIIKEDLSDALSQLEVPTLIIWGEQDKIKKIKEAYLIKTKIKNSKLEIIPNVSHNPHQESPEKLAGIILNSLKLSEL